MFRREAFHVRDWKIIWQFLRSDYPILHCRTWASRRVWRSRPLMAGL
jgi:hypothetical protein